MLRLTRQMNLISWLILVLSILLLNSFKFEQTSLNLNSNEYTLQEILKKHEDAIGGKTNLDKIKTLHLKLNIENHPLSFEGYVENGKRYTQIASTKSDKIITIFNNEVSRCVNGIIQDISNENQMLYKEEAYIFRLYNFEERGWQYKLGKIDSLNNVITYISQKDRLIFSKRIKGLNLQR